MSSKNAMTYGIFSTSPLLPSESEEEFEALKQGIAATFPPVDTVAAGLVERIVLAILRQQRLRVAEAAKLKISMTPEILAAEASETLNLPFLQRLTANDISEKQEKTFKYWELVLEEFKTINIAAAPKNLGQVSITAPEVYHQLKQEALKSSLSYDLFMKTPTEVIKALEEIKMYAEKFIETNTIKHRAFDLTKELKLAKLIPAGTNLAFLSKYQVQLDTDLYRAIDAYKRHVAWRSEVLEVEVEETVIEDTQAIAA
jgi:hypothetical protein